MESIQILMMMKSDSNLKFFSAPNFTVFTASVASKWWIFLQLLVLFLAFEKFVKAYRYWFLYNYYFAYFNLSLNY